MDANKKLFRLNRSLRAARERRGWSQAALAQLMGTSELTVGRWERGERTPQLFYRAKLCELFEMTAEDLGLVKAESVEASVRDEDVLIGPESIISPVPPEPIVQESQARSRVRKELLLSKKTREAGAIGRSSAASRVGKAIHYLQRISVYIWLLILLLIASGVSGCLFLLHAFPSTAEAFSKQSNLSSPSTTLRRIGALPQQNQQEHWEASESCVLTSAIYHAQASGVSYCLDQKLWLSDFAYHVRLTIRRGTQAGIVFRATMDGHCYYFSIDIAGHYNLDLVSPSTPVTTLLSGFSPAVLPEAGQPNLLAVVAHGSVLQLYVNNTLVGQVQDTTYTQGYIGLCTGNYHDTPANRLTQADFGDAEVQQVSP